jgi:hypothetical protein
MKPKFLQICAILPLISIAACGPMDTGTGLKMAHKDLEQSFGNNASACFAPQINGDKISCARIATFAHYTLSFVESAKLGENKVKLLYKIRFGEKNAQSCIDNASIKEDGIRLYNSQDNFARISDEDTQINTPEANAFKLGLIAAKKQIGETCADYVLNATNAPLMAYKITITPSNSPNPPEEMAFFSNGTKLELR